jgi:hypothetical protein
MGFYYGSGDSKGPNKGGGDPGGGFKETLILIWVVMRVIAPPVGILLGVVVGIFGLFWLFTLAPLAGIAVVLLIIGALVARGIWEAKHPPELR